MIRHLILALSATLLSACVTTGDDAVFDQGLDRTGPAPQPVSQQVPVGEVRLRAKAHTELGLAYLDAKRISQALDEAKVAIGIDSSYPLAYNLMGLVYMEIKENRSADEAFRQALNLATADPEISYNYGWFLCQTGRRKQSMPHFRAAYMNPHFAGAAVAQASAGLCADQNGDAKLAEQLFSDALVKEPANPRALFLYADFLFRQGRFAEARVRLSEMHRRGDATAKSVWLALKVARRLGDRQDEARYSSMLRQRYPDSTEHEMLIQGRFE